MTPTRPLNPIRLAARAALSRAINLTKLLRDPRRDRRYVEFDEEEIEYQRALARRLYRQWRANTGFVPPS